MTLADWIKQNGKGAAVTRLASALGCDRSHVHRMARGTRFPNREKLRGIYIETAGAVTPNDFVDLPDLDCLQPGDAA